MGRSFGDYNDRDEKIIAKLKAGISLRQIVADHSLSMPNLRRIAKQAGVTLPKQPRRIPMDQMKPTDQRLVQLGIKLESARAMKEITPVGVAKLGLISEQRLSMLEKGLYDPRFIELLNLVKFYGLKIEEVIVYQEINVKLPTAAKQQRRA